MVKGLHISSAVRQLVSSFKGDNKVTFPLPMHAGDSAGKESTCKEGDLGLTPGLGRSPGEGNSYPLQYSVLENSMDYIVHGVAKSWTRLSNFHSNIDTCR